MTSIIQEDPLAKPTNPLINPQESSNPPSYNDIIDKVGMYSIPDAWQRRSDLYLQKQSAQPPLTEQEQQELDILLADPRIKNLPISGTISWSKKILDEHLGLPSGDITLTTPRPTDPLSYDNPDFDSEKKSFTTILLTSFIAPFKLLKDLLPPSAMEQAINEAEREAKNPVQPHPTVIDDPDMSGVLGHLDPPSSDFTYLQDQYEKGTDVSLQQSKNPTSQSHQS